MPAWPEPVRRVAEFLAASGAESRLEELAAGTSTARDAARAIGCDLGQIVKSLVFDCGGRPTLVLVPGDRRADAGKVAAAVRCDSARVATREQVQSWTGFAPGAVAPFPLPGVRDALIERMLLARDVVWVGAGSDHHMVGLAPGELVRLARARAADVVERD